MPRPQKWTQPTPAQEWERICEAEDKAILAAYVKAGDPAAIAHKKKLEKQDDDQSN